MRFFTRLSALGASLAVILGGMMLPSTAVAAPMGINYAVDYGDVVYKPQWVMDGREPIYSPGGTKESFTVVGKVANYISGERSGDSDDRGEGPIPGVNVYGRFQDIDGNWSPIYYTTTLANYTSSKNNRNANFAIRMLPFTDYLGENHYFKPGKAPQRFQVWIDPDKSGKYRLTFSERSGGVVQGYSSPKDYNYSESQIMMWGWGGSQQAEQLAIGTIELGTPSFYINAAANTGIQPSLESAEKTSIVSGALRWEAITRDKQGVFDKSASPNMTENPANKLAGGYVVVAAAETRNGTEVRCAKTTDTSQVNPVFPAEEVNWKIGFQNEPSLRHTSVQVFDPSSTCEAGNVNLVPLSQELSYWSPYTEPNTFNGPITDNDAWRSGWRKDQSRMTDVQLFIRPTNMRAYLDGLDQNGQALKRSIPMISDGQKLRGKFTNMPANTELSAVIYKGNIGDTGPDQSGKITTIPLGKISQYKDEITKEIGTIGQGDLVDVSGDEMKLIYLDVLPTEMLGKSDAHRHVLTSQTILYSPILLDLPEDGVAGEEYNGKIVKMAGAGGNASLDTCDVVSIPQKDVPIENIAENLPNGLTRNDCTITGTPMQSGQRQLLVKYKFTDGAGVQRSATQPITLTIKPKIKPQIQPDIPTGEAEKYSAVEKFPGSAVQYVGLIKPYADWQTRGFTYKVFMGTETTQLSAGQDGMIALGGSGLKINPETGQIIGTTKPAAQGGEAVFWVSAVDNDGVETQQKQKFEIYPGVPLLLQRAKLPTGTAGTDYKNADGTPIIIWVSGGEPTSTTVNDGTTELSRNSYEEAKILHVYQEDNTAIQVNDIGGLNCVTFQSTALQGGKGIKCSGTPNVTKIQKYYLQVRFTDKKGRTLDGGKYTLPNIKNRDLDGSEGWLKLNLMPQVSAKPGAELPQGTKGIQYSTTDVKSLLEGGSGNLGDYDFFPSGLPAGLSMSKDGVITGTPLETTPPGGIPVTITLRGKTGTVAERSSTTVVLHLPVKTDLSASPQTLSATAVGGKLYTSSVTPLLDISTVIKKGLSPYSYSLRYKDTSGNWQNVEKDPVSGRYPIPNLDGSASGLLLDDNAKIVSETKGKDKFPEMQVVVRDSDSTSCPQTHGCEITVTLNLTRTDDRMPVINTESITGNVGSKVSGQIQVTDPSGTPRKYELLDAAGHPINTAPAWQIPNLPGVSISIDQDSGNYTLIADNSVDVTNTANIKIRVTAENGNTVEKTIKVKAQDLRTPHIKAAADIILEHAVPVPANKKVGTPEPNSPQIECYVPVSYTKPTCPTDAGHIPDLPGLKLEPDGTLTGTAQLGAKGDHQVVLKALGVNKKWSVDFTVNINVKPSTLTFEPGWVPGGTTGEPYIWNFKPAKGPAGQNIHYSVLERDPQGNLHPVNNCTIVANGAKMKLQCPKDTLKNKENYIIRASIGSCTNPEDDPRYTCPAQSVQDRGFSPTLYPPLSFQPVAELPKAAVQAAYRAVDGGIFDFEATGGTGVYTFGFAENSDHVQPSAPDSCAGGWALYLTTGQPSGLCLAKDGALTGVPKIAGTVDLSKLQVTDNAQRTAAWTDVPGAQTQIIIREKGTTTTTCEVSSTDPKDPQSYACHGVKNEKVGTNGELKIATIRGGAKPYRQMSVEGLAAFNKGITNPQDYKIKADWCSGSSLDDGGDVCLKGVKWPNIVLPQNFLTVHITGGAGRSDQVNAYVPVDTDLRFVEKPDEMQTNPPTGVEVSAGSTDNPKPPVIDQEIWDKVTTEPDYNAALPTVGIKFDKDALNGTDVTIPPLVVGGEGKLNYSTKPCDKTDSKGNCAIGDTGLYLDKETGKLIGIPIPGSSGSTVVIVADSDTPPQKAEANLVVQIADNRKPKVDDITVTAYVGEPADFIIPVSAGSGHYKSVKSTNKPSSANLEFTDGKLHLTGTPRPEDVTAGAKFNVTVVDENGNESDPGTVTFIVIDRRTPNLDAIATVPMTGKEGESVTGWVDLEKNTAGYGPEITEWIVQGLPDGVEFDPDTGKLSPNHIATGQSGTYPVTITAKGKNGQNTTITKNLKIEASDLSLKAIASGQAPTPGTPSVTIPVAKVENCAGDCHVTVAGSSTNMTVRLDPDGTIKLEGKAPATSESITITVTDDNGVSRTITRNLIVGNNLEIGSDRLPGAIVGEVYTQCVQASGGTKPYSFDPSTPPSSQGLTLEYKDAPESDVCVTGTPRASGVATFTFKLADNNGAQSNDTFTVKLPVNNKFNALPKQLPQMPFYAGKAVTGFTPVKGNGDSCYKLNTAGDSCEEAKISYSAENLPAGLTINPDTGEITGTPTVLVKNHNVTVTASSSAPNTQPVSHTFSLTIESAFSDTTSFTPQAGGGDKVTLDGDGKVTPDSSQLFKKPELGPAGNPTSTGRYQIRDVEPNAEGNYPLQVGGKDSGLALTPDGKVVGTLNPGVGTPMAPPGTLDLGSFPIQIKDDKGGDPVDLGDLPIKVTDPREPKITSQNVTAEVGQEKDIAIGVSGGSGEISKVTLGVCTPSNNKLSIDNKMIHVPADAFTQGGSFNCEVTATDHNGHATTKTITIKVSDNRQPQFAAKTEEIYVWEGLDLTDLRLNGNSAPGMPVSTWLLNPGNTSPSVPIKEVKVKGLPESYEVKGTSVTSTTSGSDVEYTCPDWNDCTIKGYAKQGTSGVHNFVLNITADTKKWVTGPTGSSTLESSPVSASRSVPLHIYPSPLRLRHSGSVPGLVRTKNYDNQVAVVDYLDKDALTDDSPNGIQANIDAHKTADGWKATYALDRTVAGAPSYTLMEAKYHARDDNSNTPLNNPGTYLELRAADANTVAAVPSPGANTLLAQTLNISVKPVELDAALGSKDVTSLILKIKAEDRHGISRVLTVNIPVAMPLDWAGEPFDEVGDVTLEKGITGQDYKDYYAEIKGGDRNYDTALLPADVDTTTNFTWENASAKHQGKYKGVKPVYCSAQKLTDTRPKCFPVPGLSGDITGKGSSLADKIDLNTHKGLFMLSNGKLIGSIPDDALDDQSITNHNKHDFAAQVAVIDGSGQLKVKKFTIPVERELKVNLKAALPNGKVKDSYGNEVAGTYEGGDGSNPTCSLNPTIRGLTVECSGSNITVKGTPLKAYDGNITITVKSGGQTVDKSVPLKIETDMTFQNTTTTSGSVAVTPPSPQDPAAVPTVNVTTEANGKELPTPIPIEVTGGEGEKHYSLEESDGSPVGEIPCPPGTQNGAKKCYPIGSTGLVLTDKGDIVGIPVPGGDANGSIVVVDSETVPSVKKAKLEITIADKRPPLLHSTTMKANVGEKAPDTTVVKEDPVNVAETGFTDPAQKAAAANKGFYTKAGLEALNGVYLPAGGAPACGEDEMPNWLTLNKVTGEITGNTNISAADKGDKKFCVFYIGKNGVVNDKPAVVTVKISDLRKPTIPTGSGNQGTTDSLVGVDVPAPGSSLVDFSIPSDLLGAGIKIERLDPQNPSGQALNTYDSAVFEDSDLIDGVTISGLNCTDNGAGMSKCKISFSGTPTPKAAGTHHLIYRITLPNGQEQIISHTINVPPYDLALAIEPMTPAVVGQPYLDTSKPMLAVGGSKKYWFQFWNPDDVPSGVTNAKDQDNPAKVGDMNLDTVGNLVKVNWTPTEEDLKKTTSGKVKVFVTVWDKVNCNIESYGPANDGEPGPKADTCPYQITEQVDIKLYDAPDTADLKGPSVISGTPATSPSVNPAGGTAEIIETIPVGEDDLFTISPDGKVTLSANAPVGTHTAVVRITLPGVPQPFYRNVSFEVKAPPLDNIGTPNPQPGGQASQDAYFPNPDSDTLVLRHGGKDRADTAMKVLDFFDNATPGNATANAIVAYPEYKEKITRPWSSTAILVRDDEYPDALVAGPLSAHYNAPILMTNTHRVSEKIINGLRSRGFTKIIIIGNQGAVSEKAATQLQQAGFAVSRIGGQDRYETARAVGDHIIHARATSSSDVYLATGADYPDALAASSAAIKNTGVVLLTPNKALDLPGRIWMNSAKASKIMAIGGPAVKAAKTAIHLDDQQVGKDRYATAQKVAVSYFPPNPARVAVATGKDFPDATLAASLTARTGSPLVLTRPVTLTKPTVDFLESNRQSVRKVDIVGGTGAVGDAVRYQIHQALRK